MSELLTPPRYFVPQPSVWPLVGAGALLAMAVGAVLTINTVRHGAWVLLYGASLLIIMLVGWFSSVIDESENNFYGSEVDRSFRWGIVWFIFTEVMFFAAFFGALFYVRRISVPELGNSDQALLWSDYVGQWPTAGPILENPFTPIKAWGLPALNTALLLSSGVSVTWAHWGLLANRRMQLALGLGLTVLLGVIFLCIQLYEYGHAYSELNLKLSSGVYGSTFYLLTGFHGFHVFLGASMLAVILARVLRGHFTASRHFAFEAVSWYWHFVDVVWLALFVVVYWL